VQDFFSYKTLSKGNGVTTDYYYGNNEGSFFIGTGHNQRAVSFDLAACLVKARLGKSEGGCNVERIAQVKKDIANLDAERSSLLNFIESYGERYDTLMQQSQEYNNISSRWLEYYLDARRTGAESSHFLEMAKQYSQLAAQAQQQASAVGAIISEKRAMYKGLSSNVARLESELEMLLAACSQQYIQNP